MRTHTQSAVIGAGEPAQRGAEPRDNKERGQRKRRRDRRKANKVENKSVRKEIRGERNSPSTAWPKNVPFDLQEVFAFLRRNRAQDCRQILCPAHGAIIALEKPKQS